MKQGHYNYKYSKKQKVALLMGYAMTDLPVMTLASRVGVPRCYAEQFFFKMRCRDKRRKRWTFNDDQIIRKRYEGRCVDEKDLADEIGVTRAALACRVMRNKKNGKL